MAQLRLSRILTWAVITAALSAAGCADVELGPGAGWFSKPADFFGKSGGFAVDQSNTGTFRQRPITANDLVDANGACPVAAAPAPALAPGPDGAGGPAPPAVPDQSPLLGGGIGLGMSECDVVQRAGAASAVNLGRTPAGERAATLTYNSGPRPGIYRFTAGRLVDIEAVAAPPPPPEPAKKKKPAKPKTAKKNDNA